MHNFPTSRIIAEVVFQQDFATGFPWKFILAYLNILNRWAAIQNDKANYQKDEKARLFHKNNDTRNIVGFDLW